MTVFDLVFATPTQTRQRLQQPLPVPYLDPLRVQTSFHTLANQTTGHRVGVAANVDRAAPIHTNPHTLTRLQTTRWQRMQQRQLFGQTLSPTAVALRKQPMHERRVLLAAGEVPTATQQQSLIQRPLELAVTLLHIAVLVGMARLDRLSAQTVVTQQRLIALREGRRTFRTRRNGRRQPVGAMYGRYAAQLPQGILQALAEALVALGEADGPRLPVRVRQDKVVDQMVEGRAGDGHTQFGAVREVAGTQTSGLMNLGEKHLLGRSAKGTPLLDTPLQRPHLTVGKTSGKTALQVGEQGFGFQAGVELELRFQLRPDLGEGVVPRAVIAFHASHLAGQFAEPAVLACRLSVHAGFVGDSLFGQSAEIESSQSSHLLVGDHPEPPFGRVLDSVRPLRRREI